MYTLDTNVIIYYLNNEPGVVNLIDDILETQASIHVSSITEIEPFSFSELTTTEIQRINDILTSISVITLHSTIARLAGLLRRTYRLSLADSAIAATALFTGSTLITRNTKDFESIPNFLIRKI